MQNSLKREYINIIFHSLLRTFTESRSSYIIFQKNPKTVFVQGEHNTKYNDYNDSRQKITKYELEVERLRQENDR